METRTWPAIVFSSEAQREVGIFFPLKGEELLLFGLEVVTFHSFGEFFGDAIGNPPYLH